MIANIMDEKYIVRYFTFEVISKQFTKDEKYQLINEVHYKLSTKVFINYVYNLYNDGVTFLSSLHQRMN